MNHLGTKTIETQRLILRQFRMTDAPAMFQNWASDAEVTKYLTWPVHKSVESSKWVIGLWMQEYGKPDYYQWAIELKDFGEVIGSIAVVRTEEEIKAAEVGYCIGRNWWH